MSQYLAWGQYFCFFFVFFVFVFFEVKPKNQKKQKGRTYVPVSGMGSALLFFLVFLVFRCFCNILVSDMGSAILFCLCFLVFVEVFAIFWYLTWLLPFCFFGFSGFLQYSAFPKKTLVSFPKKTFFS